MIQDFNYYTPTQVVFGRGTHLQAGQLVRRHGGSRVLLVHGCESARRSGTLKRVGEVLEQQGLPFTALGGVRVNPVLGKVLEGITLGREFGADFLLAVGGGSVIDTAKAIGYGMANTGDVWDFYSFMRAPAACLPLGAVPTVAGSGSELSDCSVITREEQQQKWYCDSDMGRPRFAVVDPELTFTVDVRQTAIGSVDTIMHALERYFSAEHSALTDALTEALLRCVMEMAPRALTDPQDYVARAELLWAGILAQSGLLACGYSGGDWVTHCMANELSGVYNVAHGEALSAMWGAWAQTAAAAAPRRFAELAVRAIGVNPSLPDTEAAFLGIGAVLDFFGQLGMPRSLGELGLNLTDAQIKDLALRCVRGDKGTTIGSMVRLGCAGIARLYHLAR